MKISCIHPSRGRPLMAFLTAKNWLRRSDAIIEYLLIIDEDDEDKELYYSTFYGMNVLIKEQKNEKHSCVTAINYGASVAKGDLFIVVSDDMDCPEHWDRELLKFLNGKEDFCVKTEDGHQPFIITLPIMDRKYYERLGYIYFPEFEHLFADSDMTATAWMLGKYLKIPLKFTHKHHIVGGMTKDKINIKNENTHEQGRLLFDKRKAINFGIENPRPLTNQKIV